MSTILEKPIILDETGQKIVDALDEIKNAINSGVPEGDPVRITIVTPPTKTTYDIGDTLDLSGISVSAIFSNNYMFDITNQCVFTPANGQPATPNGIDISWTWHSTGQVFTANQAIEINVPSWSDGTAAQIIAALDAHYNNIIDLHDYWAVGDERKVNLSAMAIGDGVDESHVAQTVTMVLMNEGGKTLANPINNHSECAFIVGQKDVLGNKSVESPSYVEDFIEDGYIDNSDGTSTYTTGGWDESSRRVWCNNTYRNSIPNEIRSIFKQYINITSGGEELNGADPELLDPISSIDYFALPSFKEITGQNYIDDGSTPPVGSIDGNAEATLSQFEYYSVLSNREKKCYDDASNDDFNNVHFSSFGVPYWTRSPYYHDSLTGKWNGLSFFNGWFTSINENTTVTDTPDSTALYNKKGIAPFGVI